MGRLFVVMTPLDIVLVDALLTLTLVLISFRLGRP